MAAQIRAEWIKARSLRSTWILLGLGVIGLVAQALTGLITFRDDPHRAQSLNALSGSSLTLVIVTILGVVLAASEYGSKSIISTYTVTGDRARVIAAKAIIAAGLAAALGVLSAPLARVVASIWFGVGGAGGWDAAVGVAIHYGYGTLLAYAGFAVFGVVIGTLTRSVGVGVAIAFFGIFVIDGLLGSISFYSEYAANSVATTLLNPDIHQRRFPLFGSAIALLAFYVVVLMTVAVRVENRRDVGA